MSFQGRSSQAIAAVSLFLFLIDQLEPSEEGRKKDYRQTENKQKDIVSQEDSEGCASRDGKKDRNVAGTGEGSNDQVNISFKSPWLLAHSCSLTYQFRSIQAGITASGTWTGHFYFKRYFKRPKNKKVTSMWTRFSIHLELLLAGLFTKMLLHREEVPRDGPSGLFRVFSWPDGP